MKFKLFAVFILFLILISTLAFAIPQESEEKEVIIEEKINYTTNSHFVVSFNTSTHEGLKQFLVYSSINKNEYINDTYTCVNFTNDLIEELIYYNFGAAKTELTGNKKFCHAIVSVSLNDKVVFIEPQNDKIYNYEELILNYNHSNIIIHGLFWKSIIIPLDGWIGKDLSYIFEVESFEPNAAVTKGAQDYADSLKYQADARDPDKPTKTIAGVDIDRSGFGGSW